MKKSMSFNYKVLEEFEQLSPDRQKLLDQAFHATKSSHAPYSNFHVGAALELDNGEIILGSNQENASFPEGLCAERVALYSAASQYPKAAPICLAIVTGSTPKQLEHPAAPCGGCRQTILEYQRLHDQAIELLLCADRNDKVYVFDSILPLLPFSFDEAYLENTQSG